MPSHASREGALGISVGSSSGGNVVSVGVTEGVCVAVGSGVKVCVGSDVGVFSITSDSAGASVAAGGSTAAGASVAAGAAAPQDAINNDRIRIE